MVNILIVGHSEYDGVQLERCITKLYPQAAVYYASGEPWVSACFDKYLIDVVIVAALDWDRSLFNVPAGRKLPQLVFTITTRMGGTECFEEYGFLVLRQPFTEWGLFMVLNRAFSHSPLLHNWEFLIFRYNYRFVLLPFGDIRAIEFEPPYLTIRAKEAVFVLANNLCEVLAKIPSDSGVPVLVGRPQTGTGHS